MLRGVAVDLSEVTKRIDDVASDLVVTNEGVSALETSVDANTTDISDLATRVATNETSIGTVSTEVSTLGTDVGTNTADIAALATRVAANESDIEALSNDLNTNYLTTAELNDQLTASYIQQYEKNDFEVERLTVPDPSQIVFTNFQGNAHDPPLTLPDLVELAVDESRYEHPDDIALSNLTVERILGTDFPEFVTVEGSLIPSIDNWWQLGNPAFRWLEGHFQNVFAENLTVTSEGTPRRVLLEGDDLDTFSGDYNDLVNKPNIGDYIPGWVKSAQNQIIVAGFSGDFPYGRVSGVPDFVVHDPVLEAFRNNASQGVGSVVARLTNGTFSARLAGYFFPDVSGVTITSAIYRIFAFDAGNQLVNTLERPVNYSTSGGRVVLANSGGAVGGYAATTQLAWSVVLTVNTAITTGAEVMCFVKRVRDLQPVETTYYVGWQPEGSGGGGSGDLPAWVANSQSGVNLSGFNQDILIGVPTWVVDIQRDVALASFGGSLSYSRLTDVPPPPSIPSWVQQEFQANVYVGNFGGQFPWGRISDRPGIFTADWVTTLQGGVLLESFGGNLDYSRIINAPDLDGYATETWVNGRGFLTTATVPAPNLDGYATETWVNGRGFLTAATVPAPNLDGYTRKRDPGINPSHTYVDIQS